MTSLKLDNMLFLWIQEKQSLFSMDYKMCLIGSDFWLTRKFRVS
jgi:hypothetical protein